jgi:NtrC-family two-component system sensor histidine kinase KinB
VSRVLGLRARLLSWGAVLVVVTVASGYFSAFTFSRVSATMGDVLRDDSEASLLIGTLTSSIEDEDDALLLSLTGDMARARQDLEVERNRFDEALSALAARTTDPEERAFLGSLSRTVEAYRAMGDKLFAAEDARDLYRREVTPLLRQAVSDLARLRDHRVRSTQIVAANARDEAERATVLVGIASFAALGFLVFVAWRLARTVVAPIRELTTSVEAVRLRNFQTRVEHDADDEIGRLGAGFNRMTEALAEFNASRLGDVLAANETLEATLEALPEAVLVVDASGKVTRSNATARELFGEVLAIKDVPLPAAAAAAIRDAAAGVVPKNPSRADLGRAMTLRIDGQARMFLPRIVAARNASVVVVLDEVTDVARLDEARTEFIGAAAHELRTPLTTLRMTLALLEEAEAKLSPRQRETLATARLGCEQLEKTVDAFLDVTRAETGALVLARDRVDIRMLVDQVAGTLRARFEDRKIALDVEAPPAVVLTCDRARLGAALSNLLTNALKYSPSGGHVQLKMERENGTVRLVVDDDGPGVPSDLRERVFEKYFRVEHERGERVEHARGAGIGLYLCRQVVEAHDGLVKCDASPSGGARFVVELPA